MAPGLAGRSALKVRAALELDKAAARLRAAPGQSWHWELAVRPWGSGRGCRASQCTVLMHPVCNGLTQVPVDLLSPLALWLS